MQYLRQNAERIVVKYMLYKKPELITQMNIKEWFWSKEGKAMAWAILKAYKNKYKFDNPEEDIWNYVDSRVPHDVQDRLENWLNIDLPDNISIMQVVRYFRFMGMLFEMYSKRDNFSEKEVAALQAISELVKRGEVTQKCEDIVLKLYEKHMGEWFYNKQLKQDIIIEKQQQNKQKWL